MYWQGSKDFHAAMHIQIIFYAFKLRKKALYLSVNVFSTKLLIGDTILTSPVLRETGPPFDVVIRAMRRCSHLQCKRSTFISQLF